MKNKTGCNINTIHYYFVGPLNLNRHTKLATTVTGVNLPLSADEFDALDFLAVHKDESMSFEQLYSAVWDDAGDTACKRETARQRLDNLLALVEEAGEGFMWIEYDHEEGYTFKTRWADYWHTIP